MFAATHLPVQESKKKQMEATMEVDRSDPMQEPKQVRLADMFFLSNKSSFFYLFIFVISQRRKRGSSTSTTAPEKKTKKDTTNATPDN